MGRVLRQVALTLRKPMVVLADRVEATAWLHDRRLLLGTEFASMRDATNTNAVGEYSESYSICWLVGRSIAQGIALSSRPQSRSETHERTKGTHDLMHRVVLKQAYHTKLYGLWTGLYQTNGPTALTDDHARNLSLRRV